MDQVDVDEVDTDEAGVDEVDMDEVGWMKPMQRRGFCVAEAGVNKVDAETWFLCLLKLA